MLVTAHQTNFLPGKSVLDKIDEADAVIWLDAVQFTKGGWTNRNKLPDGSWLTVPVEKETDGLEIRKVRIAERPWRQKLIKSLYQHYGTAVDDLAREIARPYRRLISLNLGLLRVVTGELGIRTPWHFQTHLDAGEAVQAVSDDREVLLPISERLALMVAEVGGSTYLSGPSGRNYLDEAPFRKLGVSVEYFDFQGPNPSAASMVAAIDAVCS